MTSTSLKRIAPGAVALLFIVPLFPTLVSADRGGIPQENIRYHEDAQNAIAAWNGKEEVLLLTTDIGANDNGKLLEMLPLPSVPSKISQGDKQQFSTFVDMFNSKVQALPATGSLSNASSRSATETPSVQIIFKQSIGAHNITVAQVDNCDHFASWVRTLALEGGLRNYSITYQMLSSVRDHLARGISCFVFDVVDVGPDVESQEPVIYRFRTTELYYPMAITAASYGNNGGSYPVVNLFMLVDGRISAASANFFAMSQGRGFNESIEFNQSELGHVLPDIQSLFRNGAQAAHLHTTGGLFNNNNWMRFEDVVIPRSQVQWSDPFMRPESVSFEGSRGTFLTCLMPSMLISIVMFMVLFRVREQWR